MNRERLVDQDGVVFGAEVGTRALEERAPRPDLAADPFLPDDSRLWAALQNVSGGTWGGAVFDVETTLTAIAAGKKALA